MPLRIVADENIPFVREAFAPLGGLVALPGRKISADDARDADALLVRSVTRVDRALLEGSRVRFVGTATIGADHIDLPYLDASGIAFAAAPGSNAESVAQYVAAALCSLSQRLGLPLEGRSIGIVGVGHCGARVARVAEALGLVPHLCDPPLARASADPKYRPLAELAECDFLSLHVPLDRESADRTVGLIGADFLARLKPGAAIIHACRGGVVEEAALLDSLRAGRLAAAVIDVWRGEPDIDVQLLAAAAIATPHIAGYSLDGKVAGAAMIHQAFCRRFNLAAAWPSLELPKPQAKRLIVSPAASGPPEALLAQLVLSAYPIARDDAAMREIIELPAAERPARFDALRKGYPLRREFAATRVLLDPPDPALASRIARLGFDAEPAA